MEFDVDLMIPDKSYQHFRGCDPGNGVAVLYGQRAALPMRHSGCSGRSSTTLILDTPLLVSCPQEIQDMLIYGTGGREVKVHYRGQRGEGVYDVAFEGLIKNVERRYRETGSDYMKQEYESFMQITPCKTCKGQRLKKESLAVTVGEKNIAEVTDLSVRKLHELAG